MMMINFGLRPTRKKKKNIITIKDYFWINNYLLISHFNNEFLHWHKATIWSYLFISRSTQFTAYDQKCSSMYHPYFFFFFFLLQKG